MRIFSEKAVKTVLIFFIICCTIPACSADRDLEISGYLSPGDMLTPGQQASAVYSIDYDFESDDESLQLYTGLINPRWEISIIIDGVYHYLPSKTGRYVNLDGFELYYDGNHVSEIELTLNGTVPDSVSSGNYTIIRAIWYDYDGSSVDEETIEAFIVDPSEVAGLQDTRENELSVLRDYLDGKYLLGVDTALAEVKFDEAEDYIETAAVSDSASASTLLAEAKTCIDESYSLANEAWADFSIEQASIKIDIVNDMIGEYEDEGLSGDSRVWVVRSYADNAETLLVLAEDKTNIPDYDSARDYAEQAELKAEQAYEYAVSLNEELDIKSPAMVITSTATATVSAASTTSGLSSDLDELIPDIGDGTDMDDIDDLIHSEVDLESTMQILSMIWDGLVEVFDFLGDLISAASDN